MTPSEIARLVRTLRHLRPIQIVGQLRRPLRRREHPRRAGGVVSLRTGAPHTAFLGAAAHARASTARRVVLLNRAGPVDWAFVDHGPLWQFHLHYHDWLRASGLTPAERAALVRDWIEHHRVGVGWHPATISLRAFVWTKLLLTPDLLPRDPALALAVAASLADQLTTLAAHPERDLLANHYLFNLLAIVLGGVLFQGADADRWLGFERDLRRELAEQILPDGAHYERSPMYHALVLEAVLDVLNIATAAPGRLAPATEAALRDVGARMLGAQAVWTHPDGEISLFADAAFGIAPAPAALAAYAVRLGLRALGPPTPGLLDSAGYVQLASEPFTLIATAAAPMPAYQPGHAHCDALSFELSVGNERVVTDTGVYEYAPGPRRDQSRATASHATLEVDGQEQAELWGAHRIGGRPRVAWLGASPPEMAEAVCSGWSHPEVRVRRHFALRGGVLEITDRVEGEAARVTARLPLAPGLDPSLEGPGARIRLASGDLLSLDLPPALRWRLEPRPYFPEFGREVERLCLVGEGPPREAIWRLRIER